MLFRRNGKMGLVEKKALEYSDIYILAFQLYLIRIFLCVFVNWDDRYINAVNAISHYLFIAVFLMFIVMVILSIDMIDAGWFAGLLLAGGLLLFLYYLNRHTDLLMTVLFSMFAYGVSARSIIKTHFWTTLIILVIILTLWRLGVVKDKVEYFKYGTGRSLGTNHPNGLAAIVLALIVSWEIVYNQAQINIKLILTCAVLATLTWSITKSRTSLYLMIMLPFLLALVQIIQTVHSEKILWFVGSAAALLLVGSVYLMLRTDLHNASVDSNFMYRFSSPYYLYKRYGIHLIGGEIEYISLQQARITGQSATFIDSTYLYMLIYNGIIPTIILLVLCGWIGRRCYLLGAHSLLAIFAVFLIQGLMENMMYKVAYNITFVLAFANIDIGTACEFQQPHSELQDF